MLCDTTLSIREIIAASGATKSVVERIRRDINNDNVIQLDSLLEMRNAPGRKTILTEGEEEMIKREIKEAAKLGFAIENDSMRQIMGRVANDGRKENWKNGVPSAAAIRSFRSRNRDVTFRRGENKDYAKLRAESYEHIKTFFDAMISLEKKHPGITSDGDRVWNIDETKVDCTKGTCKKTFTSSSSHHGGSRGSSSTNGMNKQITAVVAISASGRMTPPFFIVAGKRALTKWFGPVTGRVHTAEKEIEKFIKQREEGGGSHWFPKDGVIKVTENGSMEKDVIAAMMKHINKYVRNFVPEEKVYAITLDGHSSRKGIEWIEVCRENRAEAVVNASDTSQVLQPCDQDVNHVIQSSTRTMRDTFLRCGTFDTKQVTFNLACAIWAYEQVTAAHISCSFHRTCVFPLRPSFAEEFKSIKNASLSGRQVKNIEEGSSSVRVTDRHVMDVIRDIAQNGREGGVSIGLDDIRKLLREHETAASIAASHRSTSTSTSLSDNLKNEVLDFGTQAECVTAEEAFRKRKEAHDLAEAQRLEKEAEKARKEAEKEAAQAEKEERAIKRVDAEALRRREREADNLRRAEKAEQVRKARELRERQRIDAEQKRKNLNRKRQVESERQQRLKPTIDIVHSSGVSFRRKHRRPTAARDSPRAPKRVKTSTTTRHFVASLVAEVVEDSILLSCLEDERLQGCAIEANGEGSDCLGLH